MDSHGRAVCIITNISVSSRAKQDHHREINAVGERCTTRSFNSSYGHSTQIASLYESKVTGHPLFLAHWSFLKCLTCSNHSGVHSRNHGCDICSQFCLCNKHRNYPHYPNNPWQKFPFRLSSPVHTSCHELETVDAYGGYVALIPTEALGPR